MDSEQWLECRDFWIMALSINPRASERKKRLLAVAFCRHVAHLLSPARCRELLKWAKKLSAFGNEAIPKRTDFLLHALDEAEQCADGLITVDQLEPLSHCADLISFVEEFHYACYSESWGPRDFKLFASSVAASAIHYATFAHVNIEHVHEQAARAILRSSGNDENREDPDEVWAQCELARDLFPNPDCSYVWQPKWSSPKVVELAETIYQSKAFEGLPNLGKALQKVGCRDNAVLAHCKSSGPHVRGCWVVDAVLGKS